MASPLPNELSGDSNSSVYRTKVSQYLEREDNLLIPPANFYRSNSFTLQEQGGHTSSQIRKAALNHDFAKRRMSRSLPELRNFRIAPVIVDNSYIESIYSDDTDSYVVHDFPVQPIWNNKGDLFLTCIGLSLGLNNFWRYSYLSYISPGSFYIAYLILMLFCGLPTLCLEYAVGQLTQRGSIASFRSLCPLLKGVGLASTFIIFALCPMYSTINSWSLFYFFKSFRTILPWSKCSNKEWNTEDCIELVYRYKKDVSFKNDSLVHFVDNTIDDRYSKPYLEDLNETGQSYNFSGIEFNHKSAVLYAGAEFFDNKLLLLDLETVSLGSIRWELFVTILLTWIAIFFILRKTAWFSNHPTHCLAILPYMIITALLVRTLMLDGAISGIIYFFKPQLKHLLTAQTWLFAAAACFHSLGSIIGTSLSLASCNKEHNNVFRDCSLICCFNVIAITIISCIIYGTLGFLAVKRKTPIEDLLPKDVGVAFLVFGELLSTMPISPLWSVLFYLCLFLLGTDYLVAMMETLLTAIEDAYPSVIKYIFQSHQMFLLTLCSGFAIASLFFITQKGLCLLQLIDFYFAIVLLIILALFEIILIGWFYGSNKFSEKIRQKTRRTVGCFISFCWSTIAPLIILFILAANAFNFDDITFRDGSYKYSDVIKILVQSSIIIVLLIIPLAAYHQIRKSLKRGSFLNRILTSCKPKEVSEVLCEVPEVPVEIPPRFETFFDKSNHTPTYSDKSQSITFSLIQGLDRETII